jgi:hypothetical protein
MICITGRTHDPHADRTAVCARHAPPKTRGTHDPPACGAQRRMARAQVLLSGGSSSSSTSRSCGEHVAEAATSARSWDDDDSDLFIQVRC